MLGATHVTPPLFEGETVLVDGLNCEAMPSLVIFKSTGRFEGYYVLREWDGYSWGDRMSKSLARICGKREGVMA